MVVPHKWLSCSESAYSTWASCLHQVWSSFIRIINFNFHGLLAYMSFWGLHQCLKAQLIAAFIQDIFKFTRSTIFGYNIYLTIAFLDLFLIPFEEYFSISLLLTFFTYVKKHSFLAFSFSMAAHKTFSNTSSTWAFSFIQQHLKWPGGVLLHSAKHRDNPS